MAEIETFEPPAGEDDTPLNLKLRWKLFLQSTWKGLVCCLTPIIFIAVLGPFPPEKYQWCAYTLILMAVFWVTECLPLPITSFLPILIFPMTGIMNTTDTCSCYMNDTILMFLGSLKLAYAVEQSGLHKRLALGAIKTIGYSHYRLLFATSFTTMFLSMWITNTAATTMMVPIIFAILQMFEDQNLLSIYDIDAEGNSIASDIATCYFCSATFSATIGGIGTLVGTATNLVFKGLFVKAYPEAPEYLSFPNFSAFTLPYMLAMEGCLYLTMLIMYLGYLRPNSKAAKAAAVTEEGLATAKVTVDEEWKLLGRITFWEIMVIILFSGAMILFFCRSPQIFVGWGDRIESHFGLEPKFVKDSAAAMAVIFLMFLLPSNLDFFKNFTAKEYGELPKTRVGSVLDWTIMNDKMPYSFMFLLEERKADSERNKQLKYMVPTFYLGGGFALSEAAKKEYSDLNGMIGKMLKVLISLPNYLIILLIIIFTIFVTNVASNVAVCNVITPIVMQLAKEINSNPLWFNIASGFSASYCFCLPVGTPGNLVVQGAANIPTKKMIIAGFFPTLFAILLTWLFVCFWAPVIWPDLYTLPVWGL